MKKFASNGFGVYLFLVLVPFLTWVLVVALLRLGTWLMGSGC